MQNFVSLKVKFNIAQILSTCEILEVTTVQKDTENKLLCYTDANSSTSPAMKIVWLLAVLPLLLVARQLAGEYNILSFDYCFIC